MSSHLSFIRKLSILIVISAISALLISSVCGAQDIITVIQTGDVEAASAMLRDDPSLALFAREDGDTPVHQAAFIGDRTLVELLISLGADPDCRNERNQSPLLYAAYNGHAEMCGFLIGKGVEYDYQDTRGNSPVLFASRQGFPEVVRMFIKHGAEVDAKGNTGKTPLFHAAATGQVEIVKMLDEAGASIVTADDEGTVPLIAALHGGHAEAAEYLTGRGALEGFSREQYNEVMHGAAVAAMPELVEQAIENGASIDSIDPAGMTLLHNATIGRSRRLIAKALESGIDVNARDGSGRCAIHIATASGDAELVALLLEKGADPNLKADNGSVPYIIADNGCYGEVLKLLVKNGARKVAPIPLQVRRRYDGLSGREDSKGSGTVEVRYIANEGFIVSGEETSVMLDAIVNNPFGYISTGERILGMMMAGEGPFGGVDINIASHNHVDHFHPGLTVEYLESQGDVVFAANQASCDELKSAAGDRYEAIAGRVICVQPEWGEKVSREIGGVEAAFFHANHAEAENPYQTLETIFEVDGIRFLHLADVYAESSEDYIRKALDGERIDIAFLDRFFLEDSIGSLLVEEVIRPEHIIVMHLRVGEEAAAYEALIEPYPNIIVFRQQLERRLFE